MRGAREKLEQGLNRLACALGLEPAGSPAVTALHHELLWHLEGSPDPRAREWHARGAGLAPAAMAAWVTQVAEELAAVVTGSVPQAAPPVPVAPSPAVSAAAHAPANDDLSALQADPELGGLFIAEALDHLSTIESTLLQLEGEPANQKLLNDVFRPFHTIKGNSGALGLGRLQQLAHTVENLLDLARSGRYTMGPTEFDLVLQAVDACSALVQDAQERMNGSAGADLEPRRIALIARFEGLVAGDRSDAPAPPVAHEPMKRAVEVAPPSARGAEPEPEPVPAAAPVTPEVPAAAAPPPSSLPKTPAADAAGALQATVKVETRKLDSLVDMVGELVIVQTIIQSHPALQSVADDALGRQLAQFRRISSELQRNAMAMRMVPIRQTFQKMARLVRDLSRKSGKVVDLTLVGEDTELDRRVVEDITDPLMHMVRNSVDHGLEGPDDRRAAGKPEAGRLTLSAFHQAGNIVIEISDDGRGLDVDRIRRKAIQNGLLEDSDTPTAAELHQMIFRPGFSTAEKVTEVSGRGVGMDVVRRNIEALRGWIEIQTERGHGTRFAIKLPLTLAIVDGLLLRVGRERFVLPTFAIRESLRPSAEQVHSVQGRAMLLQVRNRLVPVLSLGERFGIEGYQPLPSEAAVVIVEDEGREVGLLVDELLGKQEVVIKSLGPTFANVAGVSGGAILGDGRVGLILDAHAVVASVPAESARAA